MASSEMGQGIAIRTAINLATQMLCGSLLREGSPDPSPLIVVGAK